ncbi:LPXTG cell wall anchor domain-containing protein [Enterococcus sp. AZ192]|uniref:LPXTG cell wall anchor domain-containing protein n=1 Tax=unclassified Enterococcus TaxID=2608891 RepID=UPI003D292E58
MMKQFSLSIVTCILLIGCSFNFPLPTQASEADIQIRGTVGSERQTEIEQSSKEPEVQQELAQPKQTHIALKKFPNTGNKASNLATVGFLLLTIYLLLSVREAHRKHD